VEAASHSTVVASPILISARTYVMDWTYLLRVIGPLALSFAAAAGVDALVAQRGVLPPGFAPRSGESSQLIPVVRRWLATVVLAVVFYLGIFAPLGTLGLDQPQDLTEIGVPELFVVHLILLLGLAWWMSLAYLGTDDRHEIARPGQAGGCTLLGLRTSKIGREIALGVGFGAGVWLLVTITTLLLSLLIRLLGGEEVLAQEIPPLVVWIASLPVSIRVAASLSAGFAEELFFRGFLQPRIGVSLSTVLFVLAHVGYEYPSMLVGITLLSLVFGLLVRWRGNIWAAVAAHTVFDVVQLVYVIPLTLQGG
jgi:membrane protease YdiL (CAAX protease family)